MRLTELGGTGAVVFSSPIVSEDPSMRVLLWIIAIIFLIGLLVVVGFFNLIF